MKKILLSTFSLLCLGMVCNALPTSSVLLQHKGNVVVYPLDSLNAALRDAVDDDTLFLSKGIFPGFTIDKKITVRGAGQETITNGQVLIAIPDSVTLTSTLLEGIRFQGSTNSNGINVIKPVNNLKLKQCYVESLTCESVMHDVNIDRCYVSNELNIGNYVKSMKAVNSRIYRVRLASDSSKDITFINCNILSFSEFENFNGTLLNSITGYGRTGSYVSLTSCSIINSLICTYRLSIDTTCYQENCWTDDSDTKLVSDSWLGCKYSDDELIEKGYAGNNGSVIGSNGGTYPYTLELVVPKVQSSDLKLDNENRKLNVNLILTAE